MRSLVKKIAKERKGENARFVTSHWSLVIFGEFDGGRSGSELQSGSEPVRGS